MTTKSQRGYRLLAGCLLLVLCVLPSGSWGFRFAARPRQQVQLSPAASARVLSPLLARSNNDMNNNAWTCSSNLLLTHHNTHTHTHNTLHFRNNDISEEQVEVDDGEAPHHDTIEHMASFITLRVGMAMLRRQLKKTQASKSESTSNLVVVEEEEEERHLLLHKKEGDRNLALGDEFVTNKMPSCIATDFGQPLDVLEESVPPLRRTIATLTDSAVDAVSEVIISPPVVPAVVATDFGRPLDVLQDSIPPLHQGSVAQIVPVVQQEESKDTDSDSAPVLKIESSLPAAAEVAMTPTDSVSEVTPPPTVVPTSTATDFGRRLDVLEDSIPPLDESFAQVQVQSEESKDTDSAEVTIAQTDTDNAVDADAAVPRVIIPPAPVTTKKSDYLPSSKGKKWGPVSSALDSTATASVAGASGATATKTALASDEDLIAKYFVTRPDLALTTSGDVQAKSNGSRKIRDIPGLNRAKDDEAVRTETKDFDALDLITQESFSDQIRYENVDMAKAKREDEHLELSDVERKIKGVAMAAGTGVKLDTNGILKKTTEKNQNDVTPPADDFVLLSAVETKKAFSDETKQRALLMARLQQEQRQKGKVLGKETQGDQFAKLGDQIPDSKDESKILRGGTELKMKVGVVGEEVSRASAAATGFAPVLKSSSSAKISVAPTATTVDVVVPEVMIPPSVVPTPVKTKKSKKKMKKSPYGKEKAPSSTITNPASKFSTTDTVSKPALAVTGDTELKMKVQEQVLEEVSRASATPKESKSEPESSQRKEDPIPDRQTAVTLARRQPKSPEEEKRLQEHYSSMPLEERAFKILYDLGMIEKNPKPDDPDYDHSNDDVVFL